METFYFLFVSIVFLYLFCGMEEKESVILENVRNIFMRYGIKSVTMDDISRELKISKKTLYKFVVDKPELVAKVMQEKCSCDQKDISDIVKKSKNAIDELMNVTQYVGKTVKEIHPSIHYDLEKLILLYNERLEQFHNMLYY